MERIWLPQYPKGVPHDIDPTEYASVCDMLDEKLEQHHSKAAYASMGKVLTYKEIDEYAKSFAAWMESKGMRPGDRIALMMPNILQYPIALFGALRAGLVIVNTNPLYTEREMRHQFKDSGAKAIVICENFAHHLEKILPETDIKIVVTASIGEMLGGAKGFMVDLVVRKIKKMVPPFNLPNAYRFKKILSEGRGLPYTRMRTSAEDVIAIQYTGGTTGVSKGAMLTNRNLVANMLQVKAWLLAFVKEGEEVVLTPLPLYHIYSFTVNCLCITGIGGLVVLVANPRDQKSLIKEMKTYPITMMTGVNTLFNALNNNPEFHKINFKTWRIVSGGAMAIQKPVADRWKEITGVTLCEGYGMTEASPVVSTNPFDGSGQIGTIGVPLPSTWVRMADENGQEVPIGERGEVQVKGPQVMKGYYNSQNPNEAFTADGWLKTGDVGVMLPDGYMRIVDRIKDMILVSGFNVFPNEIEDVISGHPKVLEVAAIGIPDQHSGEAVKVFVVKKDPSLTEAEVKEFAKENLTGYKCPKHIEFRTELPKTPVGKILRRALRD